MTPAQAARRLGITPQRVRQLADAGVLPFLLTPLGRLFAAADVEQLAKARAEQRGGEAGAETQ